MKRKYTFITRVPATETAGKVYAAVANAPLGQISVKAICRELNLPAYTVSKHIGDLRKDGLIESEKVGQLTVVRLKFVQN